MSPPLLQTREVSGGSDVIHITAESPTHGVVVLDVTIGSGPTGSPLHWRAGDWTKPPLDLSLSPDGRPSGVQVVFQDEAIMPTVAIDPTEVVSGLPVFDVDHWPADRYLDARAVVRTSRLPSGELALSIGDGPAVRRLAVGVGLQFGLDASDHVVEVLIGPLEEDQWRLIAGASPDSGR